MAKVEITEWGELALLENLLDDYTMHVSTKNNPKAVHARSLLARIRPALIQATNELQL